MSFLRGFGRWLLAILMGTALSLWLVIVTLELTVLNRDVVKGWVANSGTYDRIIDLIPFKVGEGSFVTTEDLRSALKTTFPASYIQTHVEAILDSSYDWVEQKSDRITFAIPVQEKITEFSTNLAALLQPKLASLPACAGMMSPSADAPTCVPKGLNIAQYAAQLSDISNSAGQDFLSGPITQDSLGNVDTAKTGWIPPVVGQFAWLLWALPLIVVVSGSGYILLSDSKLHGLSVVGKRIFWQGLIVTVFGGIMWFFGQQVSLASLITPSGDAAAMEVETTIVQNVVEPLLRNVLPSFGQAITLLSGAVTLVGIGLWATSFFLRKRGEGQKQHFEHVEHTPNPLLRDKPSDQQKPEATPEALPKPSNPDDRPKPPKPPRPLVM